jgi:hypothetical protein
VASEKIRALYCESAFRPLMPFCVQQHCPYTKGKGESGLAC